MGAGLRPDPIEQPVDRGSVKDVPFDEHGAGREVLPATARQVVEDVHVFAAREEGLHHVGSR